MLNHTIRKEYEEFTIAWGRLCAALGITPNMITVTSVLVAIGSCYLFAVNQIFWALVAFGVVALLDMLDGSTARASGKVTRFGKVFDMVSDRYAEFFFLLGIMIGGRVADYWVLTALFGMLIASYTRAVAESKGELSNCEVGIMGRAEKMIVIAVGGLLQILVDHTAIPDFSPLQLGIIITAATSIYTALQRLRFAAGELRGQ
jgi:CDP-diacylglycerol--glycerol-3-phosphate 3-phosphatidyltransferase/archaetidylinositol phosphate synthase